MNQVSAFFLGALIIVAAVLGYLYYQEANDDVQITVDPPDVSVE